MFARGTVGSRSVGLSKTAVATIAALSIAIFASSEAKPPAEHPGEAMFMAIQTDNWSEFKTLLDNSPSLSATDTGGRSPLIAVAGWEDEYYTLHVSPPRYGLALIKAGADVNATDSDGRTALMNAAQFQKNSTLGLALIRAHADINAMDKKGHTALMCAAVKDSQLGLALVEAGADVNASDESGGTALMKCADRQEALPLCLELIEAGANVNAQNRGGWTALILAATLGNVDFAIALIHAGADVTLRDFYRCTALMYANAELTAALLEAGADINVVADVEYMGEWQTPLMRACLGSDKARVSLLVKAGASLDMQDMHGRSALMLAAKSGCVDCGHTLIEAGANAGLHEVASGDTALHIIDDCEVLRALGRDLVDNAGLDINAVNALGRTPLFLAVLRNSSCAVNWFLQAGADPARTSLLAESPEIAAKRHGNDELAQLIEKAMPSTLVQMKRRLLCLETLLHLAAGAVVACGIAIAFHVTRDLRHATTRGHAERGLRLATNPEEKELENFVPAAASRCACDHARIALGALRGHGTAKLARRCLELVVVVWFPLGVCMLVVRPPIFLAFYMVMYIAPAMAQLGWGASCRQPGLLLAGASPLGPFAGLRDARWPRLAATALLLWMMAEFPTTCIAEVGFKLGEVQHVKEGPGGTTGHYFFGSELDTTFDGPLTVPLLFGPVTLLGSASVLACPATNHMPVKPAFEAYTRTLWWLTLLNVGVTLAEFISTAFTSARPSCVGTTEEMQRLASTIEQATSKEELDSLDCGPLGLPGLRVATVPFIKRFPPGGLLMTLVLAALDTLILDGNTIINQVLAYNPMFATCMAAISAFSISREVLAIRSSSSSLRADLEESRRRGLAWGCIHSILETETGVEAPLSFALTAYILPFSLTSYFSFATALASMLSSLYGLATFVVTHADNRVE